MVIAGHSLAAYAGIRVLESGGNAVDAMVAASAATAVVLGHAASIGGDCFLLFHQAATGRTLGLNASGTAPTLADPKSFPNGMHEHGPLAPVVPGLARAWEAIHSRFGRLKWNTLLESAIDLAKAHPVSQVLATRIAMHHEKLMADPGCASLYMPGGHPIGVGETLRQPALAATLAAISNEGAEAFYKGDIAQHIDSYFAQRNGLLRITDLADYEPLWVEPISTEYRSHRVEVMPPNSCGVLLLMQLNGLAAVDSDILKSDSVRRLAYQMSAMKAAFSAGGPSIADPDALPGAAERLLGPDMIQFMRAAVLTVANTKTGSDSGSTSCLMVSDEEGNAISLVQSLFNVFGSAFLEPHTGILFNNRMKGFTHEQGKANSVAPRKRPAHSLCPVMVLRGGKPRFVMATPGGLSQTLTNVQVLNYLIDDGLDVQAAVEAPRWCNTNTGEFLLGSEFPERTADALAQFGHKATRRDDGYFYGSAKVIEFLASGNFAGGADFRREAFALGV
jgi:gamma-glutamyltranspeptidase/glutathione hydrolase